MEADERAGGIFSDHGGHAAPAASQAACKSGLAKLAEAISFTRGQRQLREKDEACANRFGPALQNERHPMGNMHFIPGELEITGIYYPPMLVAGFLGTIMMLLTVYLIRRYRLSRYFIFPQMVLGALWAIYTVMFSIWVIPA